VLPKGAVTSYCGLELGDGSQEHTSGTLQKSSQTVQPAEKAVQFAAEPNSGVVERTVPKRLFAGAYRSCEEPMWESEEAGPFCKGKNAAASG
jgi:hypothetical protein